MAAPAVVGEERAEYLLDLPVHRFEQDLAAAVDAALPRTLPHALVLQATWYSESALALQQLAALAEKHRLELKLPSEDASVAEVRIVGPTIVLDQLEFLTRAAPEAEDEED